MKIFLKKLVLAKICSACFPSDASVWDFCVLITKFYMPNTDLFIIAMK